MKFDAEKENRKRQARPLKERRRRARINKSLLQLKSILLQSVNPETLFMSKLEKADLLELAKDYMQTLNINDKPNICKTHTQGESGSAFSSYSVGFNDCVEEIMRFVDKTSETNTAPDLNNRLLEHLANFASSRDVIEKCANGSQGSISEEHHAIDGLLALACPMTKQFSNADAVDQEANATILQRPESPRYENNTAKMDEERATVLRPDLISSEVAEPQTNRLYLELTNDYTIVTSTKESDISINVHTEDSVFAGRMENQTFFGSKMIDDSKTSQKIHITPNRVPLDSQPIRKRLAARFGDISIKSPRKVRPKKVKSCTTKLTKLVDDDTVKASSTSIAGGYGSVTNKRCARESTEKNNSICSENNGSMKGVSCSYKQLPNTSDALERMVQYTTRVLSTNGAAFQRSNRPVVSNMASHSSATNTLYDKENARPPNISDDRGYLLDSSSMYSMFSSAGNMWRPW